MKKNKEQIIIIIIIVIISYFFSLKSNNHEEQLKQKGKIIAAKVLYPYMQKGKSSTNLPYSFFYHNKEIKNVKSCYHLTLRQGELFANKNFPVILLEDDPEINRLLLFPSDFKKYNIPFSDSLAWVKKYAD